MRSTSHRGRIKIARFSRNEFSESSLGQAGASYLPDGLPTVWEVRQQKRQL
ncbi:hypothetical protein [Pleomorphovibrio marinus]|uniref:hypothetical protein n=1 Tax=Pleomorphovibrio marinus TaxID=2164132 RepID=UPI00130058E0|nr:hypothetical protein [Pleomorphovibrio marinus]